ncbi:MAG: iron-containing alcohol dehydrogenase [Treponema sp.]|jgi:acetaldehyde dehydrogenase/alcohol dehydrogenase|nr:iron-containing alcohol dehydrogenase [Treponema sp.]
MNIFEMRLKIYFGSGSLSALEEIQSQKVMVITDPFMVSSGIVNRVLERLRTGVSYAVFSNIEQDPSIETVAAGLKVMLEERPGAVVALGGGSALDAAKAMLYFYVREKRQKPVLYAIPTTSGTGSEATNYAVITDRQRDVKIALSDPLMMPDYAVLDAEFTRTLPKDVIANTGMDVITHAIEAYVSRQSMACTDMYAREAARVAFLNLIPLYKDVSNDKYREQMFVASTNAGIAFNSAGLGLNHAIAHTIGERYHIPHGRANSIVLPYVVSFNSGLWRHQPHIPVIGKYAELARHLGMYILNDEQTCVTFISYLRHFNRTFGIPLGLNNMGVDFSEFAASLEELTAKVFADRTYPTNPVDISKEDLKLLLLDIYNGSVRT